MKIVNLPAPAPHKHHGLKTRLFANVLGTHPFIVLRIAIVWILFAPWFLVMLVLSSWKAAYWSRVKNCREFMKAQELAFPDIDPQSLKIESLSGGVSNSNHLWRCLKTTGEPVTYFAKVFMPVGTFWARNLSLVSPFPAIHGISSGERFAADLASRVLLAERGIAVPRMIAYDPVKQILVTEFLEGENLDSMLIGMAKAGVLTPESKIMIAQCGNGLGKIHSTGYSLIDTQPINCVWSPRERRVYFTDLEFCTQRDKRLWDVSFFLCFLAIRLPEGLKNDAREIFIAAYEKESPLDRGKLEAASAALTDYIPIFKTVLDVRMFKPEELLPELLNPGLRNPRS